MIGHSDLLFKGTHKEKGVGDGCAYSTYSYVRDVREDKQSIDQLG